VKYVSTRGQAPVLLFDDVLLAGLARDGGLYVPETWPRLKRGDIRGLRGLSYADLAVRVMTPFIGGRIGEAEFAAMVADTYAAFTHPAIAPMKQLAGDHWLMELFHGPTLSFKDYALQLVGRMFDHVLARKGRRATIVGATSGDTGSAAIEACRDRNAIDVFILHPKDRVSEVQRRQMTTVDAANIYNIAIEGTFDDCQDLVKAMFNDTAFRDRHDLSAVNSINWARIMAQTAFYFAAAVSLGAPDRPVAFAVPTGNFGNVYAAYGARRMGLPIERLIVGSNANDILNRFFASGKLAMNQVVPTLSPSMDIQVSSNFERLLFELYGREGVRLATVMDDFRASGMMDVGQTRWERACALFEGHRRDDSETEAVMRRLYETTGEMVDPHTAIGIAAGEAAAGTVDAAIVSMATAHPAKFPDAVEEATGVRPALPRHLADLNERPERCHVLPNDLDAVRDFVAETLGGSAAA
jgi:threonine synthase